MAKYLLLQIPQNCEEDWNAMRPDKAGKFCLSCQKQVVDFTSMSDRELARYFKTYKGSTCGKFSSEQLNKEILIPPKKIPWLKYLLKIAIPAFLLSFKAAAQVKHRQNEAIQTLSATKGNLQPVIIGDTVVNETRTIEGIIKDD